MYNTIRITGHNAVSGIYEIRLNFNDSRVWEPVGSVASVNAQRAIVGEYPQFSSSRITPDLESALGVIVLNLNDAPNLEFYDQDADANVTSSLFRECFESARENGFQVHCIAARFTNEAVPVFIEYVFAGSLNPYEIPVGHRFIAPGERRAETLTCSFSPAPRLDVKLSELHPVSGGSVRWEQSDMHQPLDPSESDGCLPNWLAVVAEPGRQDMARWEASPAVLSTSVVTGPAYDLDPLVYSKDLAYGAHPLSVNPDIGSIRDSAGVGPFPNGNWNILATTVLSKLFSVCYVAWDGVLPPGARALGGGMEFRAMLFHTDGGLGSFNEDAGAVNPEDMILNWNLIFGYNWYDGSTFSSPATYPGDLTVRDFVKGFAAFIKCRIDKTGDFTSEGIPYVRFIPLDVSAGTFPDLEEDTSASSEDVFITDKDGVRIKRRGFEGGVICPAHAKNPVDIEIPFVSHCIAYESAPAFDRSRMVVNNSLAFIDQWKCGHRGALTTNGLDEDGNAALNPDGWVVGAHPFLYSDSSTLLHFPSSHSYEDIMAGPVDADSEAIYWQNGWKGYYPVQATYDRSRDDLDEEARKKRQINPLISYALAYGQYIRGQRRQLRKRFRGVVAPNWNSIKTGMEYVFTPVETPVTYAAVEIVRDVSKDIIDVLFEEINVPDLDLSYYEEGDSKAGSGSIGGQGSTNTASTATGFVRTSPTVVSTQSIKPLLDIVPLQIEGYEDSAEDLLPLSQNVGGTVTNVFSIANNGNLLLKPYGTASGETNEIRFYELAANGTNYTGFKAPDSLAGNLVYVLPATATDGYVLQYDSTGNALSWVDPSAFSTGGSPYFDDPGTSPSTAPSATGTHAIAAGNKAVSAGTESIALGFAYAKGSNTTAIQVGENTGTNYGLKGTDPINAFVQGYQNVINNSASNNGHYAINLGGTNNTVLAYAGANYGGQLNSVNATAINGFNGGGYSNTLAGNRSGSVASTSSTTGSSAENAVAVGGNTNAVNGVAAVAQGGHNLIVNGFGQQFGGRYNVAEPSSASTSFNAADPLWGIGVGTGTATNARATGIKFLGNGNLIIGGQVTGGAAGVTGSVTLKLTGETVGPTITTATHAAARTHTIKDIGQNGNVLIHPYSTADNGNILSVVAGNLAFVTPGSVLSTTNAIIIDPNSLNRNLAQPTNAAYHALVLKGAASQSANIMEVRNSSSDVRSLFDEQGFFETDYQATIRHLFTGGADGANGIENSGFAIFQGGASSAPQLTVIANASQSNDIFRVESDTGTELLIVDLNGNVEVGQDFGTWGRTRFIGIGQPSMAGAGPFTSFDVGAFTQIEVNPPGVRTINSLLANGTGQHIDFINVSANNITFVHQDGASPTNDRIICPGGVNFTLTGPNWCELRYSYALNRWILRA